MLASIFCNQLNDFDSARTIMTDLDLRFPEMQQHDHYYPTRAVLEMNE